jgi:hypothetical protein
MICIEQRVIPENNIQNAGQSKRFLKKGWVKADGADHVKQRFD